MKHLIFFTAKPMYHLFKNIAKRTAFRIASAGPMISYLRKTGMAGKTLVLMYHEIADDREEIEAWTVVKRGEFLRQMEYLSKNYDILSIEDAIDRIYNPANDRSGKPAAVITFDDGYAGNYGVLLPIVKAMNIPVTIFVATSTLIEHKVFWYDRLINGLNREKALIPSSRLLPGDYHINFSRGARNWSEMQRLLSDLKKLRPEVREEAVDSIIGGIKSSDKNSYSMEMLTIDELKGLADCPLVTIGAHSHCHNILTQLSEEDVRESVRVSKELLEALTGRPVRYFSYPNGDFNESIANVVRETGFKCSLTTVARPWVSSDSPFAIPRIGIGRYDTLDDFKIKTSGIISR